jgi:hypothetical protein
VTSSFFELLGLSYFSHIKVSTSLIICLYISLTSTLNRSVFAAFLIGSLKDLFILSGAWIDPFLFVACAVLANVLRNFILVKGIFLFAVNTAGISVFYLMLWVAVAANIWQGGNYLMIGLAALVPSVFINVLFSPLVYIPLKRYDESIESESSGFSKGLNY